ncbi:cystatin-B-like [Hypomesus transpacificus]|uniref:cystatin-B-like n=1 Tax=Hypomesus transpacificus TaxID=137520 RepID=UPI001F08573A|nr:cystatin-B-like [Hypomesus transpacificus]
MEGFVLLQVLQNRFYSRFRHMGHQQVKIFISPNIDLETKAKMDVVCGGLSKQEPATPEIQKICDKIKWQVEKKTGNKFPTYTAEFYRMQVVAGTNYYIKVYVGLEDHLHLKVFEELPCNGGQLELTSLQENIYHHAPIEPF